MVAAMSEKAPDNAEQLRRRANRRLLGASVLLLIAIIAVPMFLEREPPALPDNVDVRIPPVEGTKFDPKFPDGKKTAEKPAEIPAITEPTGSQAGVSTVQAAPAPVIVPPVIEAPKAAAVVAPVVPAVPKGDAPNATPKAPEKAAEKAPVKALAEAERKPGQLVIQVIAVRDAAVAKQMYERAKSLKFPAYTEQIDVTNGKVTRVRVGPYATKLQAESARAKLAQAGFEAKVLTLQ